MFLSRNEANSYGSTKSPAGMSCLIKSRQVCKSSMLSPNFTLIKRSLWKPSFKTSCLKIISEHMALVPASERAAPRTAGDPRVSPVAAPRSSQATARTAATRTARTPEAGRPRGARGARCGRRKGPGCPQLLRRAAPDLPAGTEGWVRPWRPRFPAACSPGPHRFPRGVRRPSRPRRSPLRPPGGGRGAAHARGRAPGLLLWKRLGQRPPESLHAGVGTGGPCPRPAPPPLPGV